MHIINSSYKSVLLILKSELCLKPKHQTYPHLCSHWTLTVVESHDYMASRDFLLNIFPSKPIQHRAVVNVQWSELKQSWHCWAMTIMHIWWTADLAAVTDTITCDRCQTPAPIFLSEKPTSPVTYAYALTHSDTEPLWVTNYPHDLWPEAGYSFFTLHWSNFINLIL